jgi:cytochrome d ubiquinol oxidase subunit II
MTRADILLGVLWIGLTLYAVLAGADFGAGIWHLVARVRWSADPRKQRELLEHTIGPVWEANHVWLIFVITLFWTAFPAAFGPFAATLYIPLTIVALGVIARGAAFAFRKASAPGWQYRVYGLVFGVSSLITPFVLGMIAGALAAGRVPPVIGSGAIISSWVNPVSAFCGVLAVGSCAYLAAVYLTGDAAREGDQQLAGAFRRRALITGVAVGLVALAGLAVLRSEVPALIRGLTGRGLPIVILSLLTGAASLVLVARRRYLPARVTAAATVATLLWGWGAAQYPVLLAPDLTVDKAAATPQVLSTVLVVVIISGLLLFPAMAWLFLIFQRAERREEREAGAPVS